MKFQFVAIIYICVHLLFACSNTTQKNDASLERRLDSLEKELALLKSKEAGKATSNTQTAILQGNNLPEMKKDTIVKKAETPEKRTEIPIKKKLNPSPPAESNDTTYYKYSNGKISVKITPWENGKRKIFFYDLKGIKTFELEDVRMSYTTTTKLSFHPNGGVSQADIHHNPGASRYWYETKITFSTTNDPQLKYDKQMPENHLDLDEQKPSFWIPNEKKWMKQEIVRETNSPPQK